MWLFLLPLLFSISWHPEPQKIQYLGFGIVAMLAVLIYRKKGLVEGLQWGWISWAWVTLSIWSLVRLSWSREYASLLGLQALVIVSFLWVWPQRKSSPWLPGLLLGVSALAFLLQQLMGEIWWYQYGPFNQENHAQLFHFAVLFAAVFHWPKPSGRWLLFSIPMLAIVLSGAKAVQMALVITVFAWLVFRWMGRRKIAESVKWTLATSLTLLFAFAIPLWLAIASPLTSNSSLLARQDIWWAAKEMLANGASWLGIGTGEFGALASLYMPDRWSTYWQHLSSPNGAHNLFLQYAVEWGILGLALVLLIYVGSLVGAWNRYQREAHSQDLVHLSFLVGMLPIIALTHAIYGFPSSVLFFVWMTVQGEKGIQIPDKLTRYVKYVPLLLLLLLGLGTVWTYRQLDAESQVREIFVQHQIQGMQDVEKIQKSLNAMPNSIAAYYAAGLFLSNLDIITASYYLDMTEELSGLRWPIAERRFEIELYQKGCEPQEQRAKQIFLQVPHSEPHFQRNESKICYEHWEKAFLEQGRSQATR